MAVIKCKGTALQIGVAGTAYTTVAQVISMTLPSMESETFVSDTLDNPYAGIPYMSTGRTEGGSVTGELFLDPALANHTNLLTWLTQPDDCSWKIVFANVLATKWTFVGAGFSLGGTVALNDGLKATFGIKLDGIPDFEGDAPPYINNPPS